MPSSNATSPYYIEPAQLQWHDDRVPQSTQFDDIYFSREHGLAETDYVFLQHNQLRERWQALDKNGGVFCIGETGFGTGLNFLAALKLWQETAPPNWQLHFLSVEKHPLRHTDLQRALAQWPELTSFSRLLIDVYPLLLPGHHVLEIPLKTPRLPVSLHLWLGEASAGLEQWRHCDHPHFSASGCKIDAWFLDGFAPVKNPAMWQPELFQLIRQLSAANCSFATFTSAGVVRRGLQTAGFKVEKVIGFGSKREMLTGKCIAATATTTATEKPATLDQTPWYIPATTHTAARIVIVGGGLAGILTAHALARRGRAVTLLEQSDALAAGASGNPQGMLYCKLSPQAGTLNLFTLSAFAHALRYYRTRIATGDITQHAVNFCGLLQLATDSKSQTALMALREAFAALPALVQFISADEASALAGVALDSPGWFFPGAGWADPGAICRQLARHPLIDYRLGCSVQELNAVDDGWRLQFANKPSSNDQYPNDELHADTVIIATSHDAARFAPTAWLPLKPIRGQITGLPANAHSATLSTVICHDGYLTPAINGMHSVGATFDNFDTGLDLRADDNRRNLDSLFAAIPTLRPDETIDSAALSGRAALRCASPDYLPLVGPVPDHSAFIDQFATLRFNARKTVNTAGPYLPGLFLNAAHGSRGLTSIPLCAELIASMLCNEPAPLPRQLATALNPARFIIRDLSRNKL